MSKGSRPRPLSVDQKKFDSNWDRIFGRKTQPKPQPTKSPDAKKPAAK